MSANLLYQERGIDVRARKLVKSPYMRCAATRATLPRNWRERLTNPSSYYASHLTTLGTPNSAGWSQGRCPFHDDRNASFSVRISDPRGYWRCFAACGHGDMVAFHMRLTGLGFVDAVRDLVGVRAR